MERTCGVILLNEKEDEVMLVHSSTVQEGVYCVPHLPPDFEIDETDMDTAERAFLEKTGVSIYDTADVLRPVGVFKHNSSARVFYAFGAIAVREANIVQNVEWVNVYDAAERLSVHQGAALEMFLRKRFGIECANGNCFD